MTIDRDAVTARIGSFLAWLGGKPPWVWAIVGAIVIGAVAATRGRDEA